VIFFGDEIARPACVLRSVKSSDVGPDSEGANEITIEEAVFENRQSKGEGKARRAGCDSSAPEPPGSHGRQSHAGWDQLDQVPGAKIDQMPLFICPTQTSVLRYLRVELKSSSHTEPVKVAVRNINIVVGLRSQPSQFTGNTG